MPSENDLAKSYAQRIRAASLRPSGLVRKAAVDRDFRDEVRSILADIDGLEWVATREKLSDAEKANILRLVDAELGVDHGTFGIVKKGSLAGQQNYEAALLALLQK